MLTAQDLEQLQTLFERNNAVIREDIQKDIQKAVAPLATKAELEELKAQITLLATKKELGKLRRELKLFTRFFDKQIADLRKEVAAIKSN